MVPSFRVIVAVGSLRPGVAPPEVLPAAAAAAAELTVVEASSVDVVSGEARLTVRFTADSVDQALVVGLHVAERVRILAQTGNWRVTERVAGRWFRRG
ncbi:hypothetical protein [Leifsonia poae]|uniref:hypothetical protein n=1 Tax=Leifsonia poae TaxID=110933 RepID=UPI0021DB66B4|nr:hypothetical protein [Leifsonia poae]